MFITLEIAKQLIRSLPPHITAVQRHDKSLADQLRRAGASVLLNIAEGDQRRGRDQIHHFRIAAGSAAEVEAVFVIAEAWGYRSADELAVTRALLDRQLRLLSRLTRTKR